MTHVNVTTCPVGRLLPRAREQGAGCSALDFAPCACSVAGRRACCMGAHQQPSFRQRLTTKPMSDLLSPCDAFWGLMMHDHHHPTGLRRRNPPLRTSKQWRRGTHLQPPVIDPVCGVALRSATEYTALFNGTRLYFAAGVASSNLSPSLCDTCLSVRPS